MLTKKEGCTYITKVTLSSMCQSMKAITLKYDLDTIFHFYEKGFQYSFDTKNIYKFDITHKTCTERCFVLQSTHIQLHTFFLGIKIVS